jgi:hypothetical protein
MKGYKLISKSVAIFDTEEEATDMNIQEDWIIIDGDLYSKDWRE